MNKSYESLIHGGGDISSEQQSSEDIHESSTGNERGLDGMDIEDFIDDNNFESNLRRRKGKIITCAKETFENASRQLRRKVPYAGHLMTPRRLWLNKIPTQCDVVIEFPEDAPDEALRWLLARIRSQPPSGLGLVVQVKAHESSRRNAFYVSAPTNILFKAAEEARLPKRLRPDLGGALREFTTRESHCFQQLKTDDGSTVLFTSQERQWLVLQVLQSLRAGQTDIDALQGRATVSEGQSIVAAWQESGLITQVFPLHETRSLAQLQANWVKNIFAPQPLDDIAEYFGVKVALYFAWLGHYTCALGVPAIFGTILYAILWGKGQTAQDMGHVLFSLFNVAWASLYLEAWKRYSVELAFRWGTLSTPPELLEPPRPLYKGPLVENNVTGRLEPREAPAWQRRAFRYLVSFPIIAACLLVVFGVMIVMLRFQDWLDRNNVPDRGIAQCMYNLHKDWWDSKLPEDSILCCLSVIPKVLLAGAITLMDEAYYKLAVWLNDRENYRLQSKYENHLIAKVVLFQFFNSFLSLFYIAFYLRDEEKLKEQLAGLLISRQIIGNLRESAIPYFIEQWKLAKLSFNMWGALSPTQDYNRTIIDTATETGAEKSKDETSPTQTPTKQSLKRQEATKRNIGQAEIESSLCKYDGTFSDHLEMLVQMGYVVLFSAAFPLAGVCALINNLMEIRSDAFKLAHVHQRPFGQRVANIGTWQNALSILSLAAVIVNCALIGLSGQVSRLWPGLSTAQTIILIVTLEHIMLGLRTALTWLLPELPSWLAAEIARAEHCRREMQCKGTSPRPTPPTPPSTTSTQPDQEILMAEGCGTITDHSLESQMCEELALYQEQQYKQHAGYGGGASGGAYAAAFQDEISNFGLQRNIEADVNIFENRDSSPDSPPSQTSTILIRPLHESTPPNSGASLTSLNHELSHGPGGASINSASTLALTSRQPIHLPEIPPFRKKSNDSADHTGSSASSSPHRHSVRQLISTPPPMQQQQHLFQHYHHVPKVPDIPPYNPRKISAESTTQLHMSDKFSIKLHAPDWMSRLKVNENTNLHRSIDCIAKEYACSTETPEILKPAPSWSNVAMKPSNSQQQQQKQQQQQVVASSSSSSGGGSASCGPGISGGNGNLRLIGDGGGNVVAVSTTSRPSVGGISTSSSSSISHQQQQQQQHTASTNEPATTSGGGSRGSIAAAAATGGSAAPTTPSGNTDDEAKVAELAAKKSRLKQKLVKSARSVAIFSLKLKERRQREAEKAATIAVEHAKALAKLPPPPQFGGELSLIPIEQLIQIDDIKPNPKSSSSSSTTAQASTPSQQQHHHYQSGNY